MKLTIAAGSGKQRRIDGPFAIKGNREDIQILRDELDRVLQRTNSPCDSPFIFGWVEIVGRRPKIAEGEAEGWE